MLLLQPRFLIQQGARDAKYLVNPNIIPNRQFHLPQRTIIHSLDLSIDSKFPNRNHYYFNALDESKKIRITNVTEMTRNDGVASVLNKRVAANIQEWRGTHRKSWYFENLLEEPLKDNHNTSVVNYNLLKDKYKYMSSLLATYDKHYNLMTTFADTLKQYLDGDKDKWNLVSLTIPESLLGYNTMNKLMTFTNRRLTEVISDVNMFWFFEWYKWVTDTNRPNSVFKEITDNDSERVLLEIKYKGYAIYTKLSTIRGLSEESTLSSFKKMDDIKLQKFFLTFMFNLQEKITEMNVSGIESSINLKEDSDPLDYVSDEAYDDEKVEQQELDAGDKELLDRVTGTVNIKPNVEPKPKTTFLNKKPTEDIDLDKVLDGKPDSNFDSVLETIDALDDLGHGLVDTKTSTLVKAVVQPKGDIVDEKPVEEVVELVEMDDFVDPPELDIEHKDKLLKDDDVYDIAKSYYDDKSKVTLTSPEMRSIKLAVEKRKRLKAPDGSRLLDSVNTAIVKPTEMTGDAVKIDVTNNITANDLFTDKTKAFDREYIEKYLNDDIISVVKDIERAGIIINGYSIERTQNSVDKYDVHKIELRVVGGSTSTLHLRVPVIDSEGTYMATGRMYRLRKTKQDLPIRKISETRVALTSNYGKFFISRSTLVAYDTDAYVVNHIRKDYLSGEGFVTKIIPGNKRLNTRTGLPNLYYSIASVFDKVVTKDFTLVLNDKELHSIVKDSVIKTIDSRHRVCTGFMNDNQNVIGMDQGGNLWNETTNTKIGNLIDLLGISPDKVPRQFSNIMIMGKAIPFGVVMSYYIGLTNLIGLTKTKYKLIPNNKRYKESKPSEVSIRFEDYRLVLDLDTTEKKLIFNGFNFFKDFIKGYKLSVFDNKDVYLPMIESKGFALYHIKEMDNLKKLFLDSITKSVLLEMNEPTEYIPLIMRANQMLSDYGYPDINDPTYSRLRGYDRVPGLIYRSLTESIREANMGNRGGLKKIEMSRYKVWNMITQDQSHQSREAINPVSYIKEDETVTLTGIDGLSTQAVPKEMRRYHYKDTGLFTESTSDSKNVAIASNVSPYFKVKNIRGTIEDNFNEVEENPGKVLSTPVQVSPFSEYDDQEIAVL